MPTLTQYQNTQARVTVGRLQSRVFTSQQPANSCKEQLARAASERKRLCVRMLSSAPSSIRSRVGDSRLSVSIRLSGLCSRFNGLLRGLWNLPTCNVLAHVRLTYSLGNDDG